MAKDKRLLIARAVMQHIVRKKGGVANATRVGLFIQFIVHPRLLTGGGTSGGSATTNSGGASAASPSSFGVGVGGGNSKAQVKTIMTVGGKKVVPVDGERKPRGAGFNSVTSKSAEDVASGSSFDGAFVHKVFQLPNAVFPVAATAAAGSTAGGGPQGQAASKTSALIVSKDIAVDCVRINKRYKYYDYVCAIESLATEGYGSDETTIKRAAVVAQTFQRFVVDRRCVGQLPRSIAALLQQDQRLSCGMSVKKAAHQSDGGSGSQSSAANLARDEIDAATKEGAKSVTLIDLRKEGSLEGEDLPFLLGQGAKGQALLVSERDGRCLLRVGHAGMSPGEVTANVNQFAVQFKSLYPTVYRSVTEFKLLSSASEPIRYMATNAAQ